MAALTAPDLTKGAFALSLFSLFAAPGCDAAPSREPQAVLQPMLAELNGLIRQMGAGRIIDGPTRVHCNTARNNDPTVRWQVFARAPVAASTPGVVSGLVDARRAGGWTVLDKSGAAEKTYLLRKNGVVLTVTYLANGRGDVVLSGQTACFTPSGVDRTA